MRALLSGALTAVSLVTGSLAAPASAAPVVPDEVIVRFSDSSSSAARTRARAAVGGTVAERLPLTGAQVLELDAGESPEKAAARLERMPGVELAEPNTRYAAWSVPNDPAYPSQWALPVIGAPEAWDLTTGHQDVMVAVVDTGVTAQHPDLAAAVDPHGRDFVDPGTPPLDPNGHGTHVAAVIAAQRDDGFGMAGLAPRSRLLPVRVLDGRGIGDAATISEGLAYAARTGARVVNGSFGGPDSQLMHDTIDANPGVLFVFAAGNSSAAESHDLLPDAPCRYELPNVLCVTAGDRDDQRPYWAKASHDLTDLAAPGVDVLSALPAPRVLIDDGFEGPQPGTWTTVRGWQRVPRDGGGHALAVQRDTESSSFLSTTVDLRGLGDCLLEYEVLGDAEDLWIVFGRPGNADTYTLGDTAGNEGIHRFELPQLETTAEIGFGSSHHEGALDDVALRCRAEAAPTRELGALSGTSMAAPHVAGVAALAWARDLDAPVRTIRHRLLSTVEPVPAMRDITKTGGRLDAAAAVDSAAQPPPPAPYRIDVLPGGGVTSAQDIASLPSGAILMADPAARVVRRLDPDGTRTVVAGGGAERGDGGLATSAALRSPGDVARLPGGGFVIADAADRRVRRVAPDGTISTLAGGGTDTHPGAGDTGPATSAALEEPIAVAVDAAGAVYITESYQGLRARIRKISGGVITTVAGDFDSTDRADGIPASRAWIERGDQLAPLPDGSVLFADRTHLRRVTPDGRVVAAADPRQGFAGDGGPFERARIGTIVDLAVAPDGTLLISGTRRVRAVSPDGIIRTIAGRGQTLSRHSGDGGPAVAADLGGPLLAPLTSGGVIVADRTFDRISRVVPDPTVRFTDVAPPVPVPWVQPEPEPDPTPTPSPPGTPTPEPDRPADQDGGAVDDPAHGSPAGTGRPPTVDPPTPVARPRSAVLRLLGERRGTRFVVRRLDVRAPQGAPIRLRCSGRACPVRRASVRGRGLTYVAIRAFSRRSLAGTLTITVDMGAGEARERLVARVVRGRVRIARA